MVKNCLQCGIEIKVKPSHFNRKKFCSLKCKGLYHHNHPDAYQHLKKQRDVSCSVCSKQFLRKPSEIKELNFCSRTCANIGHTLFKEKYYACLKKEKVTLICGWCEKKFEVPPHRKDTARFCSRSCLGMANGKNAKKLLTKKVDVACTNCGKKHKRKPCELNSQEWFFCNRSCMSNYYERSGSFSGWNNKAWLGGDIDYYGPNWRAQRRKARKRDTYTCQDCGITEDDYGQELSVHHIKRFREFIGDFIKANRLSNLVCLCEPCHRKRHKHENGPHIQLTLPI